MYKKILIILVFEKVLFGIVEVYLYNVGVAVLIITKKKNY